MNIFIKSTAAVAFAICLVATAPAQTTNAVNAAKEKVVYVPFDFTVAAEKAKKSVVYIEVKSGGSTSNKNQQRRGRMPDRMEDIFDIFKGGMFQFDLGPKEGKGSGVILSNDGFIITNNHVVKDADEITVKTYDDKKYTASLVGVDPSTDLAVIKIDSKELTAAELGNSDQLKVGEWVLAIGNPYDLDFTVTSGIVSAKGRNKLNLIQDSKPIEEFIQTDAAVNPGNSGGALVDVHGNLVGINTAIYSPSGAFAGYSFAIPVNLMKRVFTEIKNNGSLERVGSLGLEVSEIDESLAKEKKLPIHKGLLITTVQDGSICDYAGLVPDDIIMEVDGKPVSTFEELTTARDQSRVGQTLNFKIMRDGEVKNIPVKLRKKI